MLWLRSQPTLCSSLGRWWTTLICRSKQSFSCSASLAWLRQIPYWRIVVGLWCVESLSTDCITSLNTLLFKRILPDIIIVWRVYALFKGQFWVRMVHVLLLFATIGKADPKIIIILSVYSGTALTVLVWTHQSFVLNWSNRCGQTIDIKSYSTD